jgi:NAD(P)-dependent dehydrogenase (short-subunit alcohol dehydrogenase family)
MNKLDGKVALVSGSGRGIGRYIALKLASEGARVVVNDLDEEPAEETLELLRSSGDEALSKTGFNDTAGATHGFSARGAQQFKCFLSRFFIQIVHHDPRAFAREFQCDVAADAATGS